MEFDYNPDQAFTQEFRIGLDVDEAEVFTAAYSEHIHDLHDTGQSEDVNEFHTDVASWKAGTSHFIYTNAVTGIRGVLNGFFDRTANVVSNLPALTGVPAFRNKDIAHRQELGSKALRMA